MTPELDIAREEVRRRAQDRLLECASAADVTIELWLLLGWPRTAFQTFKALTAEAADENLRTTQAAIRARRAS